MNNIYKQFTVEKNRFYYWFLMIFLLLFALSVKKTSHVEKMGTYFAIHNGDTKSYIDPMDNYIENGDFLWKGGSAQISTANYIGRGPYYAIPYFVFSQILPRKLALDAVALFQLLLFSISLTAMIKLLDKFIKHKFLFFFYVFVIVTISVGTRYIFAIIPEIYSLSFLLLFLYYYINFIEAKNNKYLVIPSTLLAIICVLKPYFMPLYAVLGFHFLVTRKWRLRNAMKYLVVMSFPLVLITLPFTVRNLLRFNTFAPVQNTTYGGFEMDPVTFAMRKTIKTWGESIVFWDENTLGTYFFPATPYKGDFPKRLLVNGYTLHDIEKLRDVCHTLNEQGIYKYNPSDSLAKFAISEFERIRICYLKEKPQEKYLSYFRTFSILISAPVFITEDPTSFRSGVSYILQLFKVALYYLLLIFGLIGTIQLALKKQHFLVCLLTLFYIALFFCIFRTTERRFFMHAYYILIFGAIYFIDYLLLKFKKKQINKP